MKVNKKIKKKIKRIFNLYNLAILVCIIIILSSLYIIFKPEKMYTPSGIEVVQTKVEEGEEISEEQARKVAIKQFKILKEDVKEDELNIVKIQRNNEKYYYITSVNNSLEIKINGGKIIRINSATVEE